jgi:hypothetical protein
MPKNYVTLTINRVGDWTKYYPICTDDQNAIGTAKLGKAPEGALIFHQDTGTYFLHLLNGAIIPVNTRKVITALRKT